MWPVASFASVVLTTLAWNAIVIPNAETSGAGWQGSRPPECAVVATGVASNVWERAKSPIQRNYCELLAKGAAKLAADVALAERVLALCDEAEKESPGRAATQVLRGRALAALGRNEEAATALLLARSKDARSTDDASALLALARSLVGVGKRDEALIEYRALLPRASTLPASERASACIDAGFLAMAQGPSGLDEAEATFRQALRVGWSGTNEVATFALALALDRAGRRDEVATLLEQQHSVEPRRALADAKAALGMGVLVAGEFEAMIGAATFEKAASRQAWKNYAASMPPKSPWANHARERTHK